MTDQSADARMRLTHYADQMDGAYHSLAAAIWKEIKEHDRKCRREDWRVAILTVLILSPVTVGLPLLAYWWAS
jgi:hypothetical protein